MSIKIVQRYRFLPRNAGEGEVDFMLVCRKTTNWLITSMKTLFLSVKICVRWCDLYEVEDERGGSVPHAALAFGWHAVGFVQCVPVGDAPRALRVPTPCGRGVGTVRPRWGRPSVMGHVLCSGGCVSHARPTCCGWAYFFLRKRAKGCSWLSRSL